MWKVTITWKPVFEDSPATVESLPAIFWTGSFSMACTVLGVLRYAEIQRVKIEYDSNPKITAIENI